MNLNSSSRAGVRAIDLKIVSSGAGAGGGAWSISGQVSSPASKTP